MRTALQDAIMSCVRAHVTNTRHHTFPATATCCLRDIRICGKTPVQLPKTNSHDSHIACDQCTFTCGSPVGHWSPLPQHGLQNIRKRFTISMLCFTTALLTHCKRHAVAPTNRIHEATEKRITRRRQPRKNSTSEIIDGYLVCWTERHHNQMTHFVQNDNLRRREYSHHLAHINFSHVLRDENM